MSSKPFYSMDEVCEKLGKTPEQVKELVRDGALREFRDAGKIFFKSEDVEKITTGGPAPTTEAPGDTGEIVLESVEPENPSDNLSLGESGEGTSIIGLEPLADEQATDASSDEKQADTVITASGIGVFDDDELEIDADPMAKTQITEGATDDQVSLEGAGSGSGLLDLAREADDTALGADLLDEIYPGEEEGGAAEAAAPAAEEPQAEEPEPEAEEPAQEPEPALEEARAAEAAAMPLVMTRAADPLEGLLSGLLVGGLLVMGLATTVVGGVLQGYLPDFARFLGDGSTFYFFLGGSVLLAIITLLIGWFISKALGPRAR